MSLNTFFIKEGAYLISDAHYSNLRPELLQFMQDIHSQKLLPTQLILMGDIFDALFGDVAFTQRKNLVMIKLINEISTMMEVVFLEGNHDFNVQEYFPNIKVYGIKEQPVFAMYGDKKVSLAHGDFDGDFAYKIYTYLIRNRFLVRFLTFFDSLFNHPILKKLDAYLATKDDCREFTNFFSFIESRSLDRFECDYFIEGHYHQNKSFDVQNFHYINLGAFACNQRYFIVNSSQSTDLLEERLS